MAFPGTTRMPPAADRAAHASRRAGRTARVVRRAGRTAHAGRRAGRTRVVRPGRTGHRTGAPRRATDPARAGGARRTVHHPARTHRAVGRTDANSSPLRGRVSTMNRVARQYIILEVVHPAVWRVGSL